MSAAGYAADPRISVGGALAAAQAVLPAMKANGARTLPFTGGGFAFGPIPDSVRMRARRVA